MPSLRLMALLTPSALILLPSVTESVPPKTFTHVVASSSQLFVTVVPLRVTVPLDMEIATPSELSMVLSSTISVPSKTYTQLPSGCALFTVVPLRVNVPPFMEIASPFGCSMVLSAIVTVQSPETDTFGWIVLATILLPFFMETFPLEKTIKIAPSSETSPA